MTPDNSAEARIATPEELRLSADDLSVAATIVESPTVIGQYAACEWDCLDENGQLWVAAIVRAARAWDRPADTVMAEALRQCRDQFAFYGREHRAAGKDEKAATNERFAKIATDALSLAGTGGTGAEGWRDIASAPKDGTRFLALRLSRWRGESRTETVWWQPEFDAFISSCRLMEMAPGYTIDGKTSQLHSPDIFEATHWLCAIPPLPTTPGEQS